MNKLIYFTLGHNPKYIQLAKLCVESIKRTGYTGDLLFITNLKKEVMDSISFDKDPLFMDIEDRGLLFSSAHKLKIYQFHLINKYDQIIFCDLDVIWTDSPDIIFDIIEDGYVYVSTESEKMSHELWGGRIFTESEKNKIDEEKTLGISAGIFGFTKSMVHHFLIIDSFLFKNLRFVNEVLEQPFLNVYLYRNNLYKNLFNEFVRHDGYHNDSKDKTVVHFAGGPGNFDLKYEKMNQFIKKIY